MSLSGSAECLKNISWVSKLFKDKRWYPAMLALLLVVGMSAAGYAAGQRYRLETSDRLVELAMPYVELQSLARLTGKQPLEVLELFREQGLTTVFFQEPTLEDGKKSGEFAVLTGQELLAFSRMGGESSAWPGELVKQGKINVGDTCFLTNEKKSAQRLATQLKIKAAEVKMYFLPEGGTQWDVFKDNSFEKKEIGNFVIRTSTDEKTLEKIGLGFPAGPLAKSELAGLRAVVQLRNWPGVTAEGLEQVFQPLRDIPNLSAIAFQGNSVPGYPGLLPALGKNIKSLGVPVVQIEFQPQKGFNGLGALLDRQVLRLHSADPEEIKLDSFSSLQSRLVLAVAERNARILLVYPLVEPGSSNCLAQNLEHIAALKLALQQKNLFAGPVHSLPPLAQPKWLLFFMGLGVISGGLWLLWQLGVTRFHFLFGLAAVIAFSGLLVSAPQAGAKLMVFAAAIIFPVLSIQANLKPSGATFLKSILLLCRTTLFSLPGALFIVGLLADTRYMLKLDQIDGVKAAYILPLFFLGVIFFYQGLVREESRPGGEYLARLLNQPVLFKWVVVGGMLMGVLAVYLIRTGTQEIILSPALELKIRLFLDHLLSVRPRTKEFLIGHPFLLLLFYTGYRDNRFLPFLLLGAIGQISVLNTFMHLHTPLAVSSLRLFHGLWLGIFVGLVFILAWKLVISWKRKKILF